MNIQVRRECVARLFLFLLFGVILSCVGFLSARAFDLGVGSSSSFPWVIALTPWLVMLILLACMKGFRKPK